MIIAANLFSIYNVMYTITVSSMATRLNSAAQVGICKDLHYQRFHDEGGVYYILLGLTMNLCLVHFHKGHCDPSSSVIISKIA